MMLYTEDTYEVPEYPYFGRMRGRYSQAELRELDDYAYAFGIEMIPYIQTLAHLNAIFRWPTLGCLRDIDDVLLVDDPQTMAFIDKLIKSCSECFRSKRINLGFDEAHNLGRGRYLDKHGHRKTADIMLEHLARVLKLCKKYGFTSYMMDSDMFFRMQFGGLYYVDEGELSQEVLDRVPKEMTLVYWDYYNTDPKLLDNMMRCHKQFNRPLIFFAGAWKHDSMVSHNFKSIWVSKTHVNLCRNYGVTDMVVSSWGDGGAEASHFSILPSLLHWAEEIYDNGDDVCERSRECFGIELNDLRKVDLPDLLPGIDPTGVAVNPSRYLLYNDPLEGLLDAHVDADTAPATYRAHAEALFALQDHPDFGKIFDSLGCLCALLARKSDFSVRLRNAYLADDRAVLAEMADTEIDEIVRLLESFTEAFRDRWYAENKTFGLSVIELRLGGLKERFASTKKRLLDYLDGKVAHIEELEEPLLPVAPPTQEGGPYVRYNCWARISSACVQINQL